MGQESLQDLISLRQSGGASQAQFGGEPGLEGAEEPLDASLSLRGEGSD
jgi:hypothetical protein